MMELNLHIEYITVSMIVEVRKEAQNQYMATTIILKAYQINRRDVFSSVRDVLLKRNAVVSAVNYPSAQTVVASSRGCLL